VGLHSSTHPTVLANLSRADQQREYQANYERLHRLTGRVPDTMSHPTNSYNADTLEILRQMGIRLGFRANMAQAVYSTLEHPREDHANILAEMNQ